MKVLVTGGAGFIGSHVVNALVLQGHTPIVLDDFSGGRTSNIPKEVRIYPADLLSKKTEKIIKKEQPDMVIHLAAQVSVAKSLEDPAEDAAINVLGTIKLLGYCLKYNVKKFIFSSSSAVYGHAEGEASEDFPASPLSFYGTSKSVSESYIRLYHELFGLPYTILRYANVYGPRQRSDGEGGVINIFIEKLLNGEQPCIYGDGTQTRDFVYVEDVAQANVAAMVYGDNQTINIGTNTQTSINELLTHLSVLLDSSKPPLYLPKRDGDILHSQLTNLKAKQLLHWEPAVDLPAGLTKTIESFLKERE
ncbi:UDP-glucose 4-epimerase [Bacillus ectoiniformans]|uniref:NAD-dependent epimerase/dehydratase family protein n=1 Tax=Bacillus ectoiniformans TaxID=1494429 RepID=UPI00195BDA5A|nr:NAD-dependent epimerase/dehydratase family protein [Bacillus ectoiniformans]MBM7647437.1 UDP-glucose 4-epimerase [Bacillus ectoiniformans]